MNFVILALLFLVLLISVPVAAFSALARVKRLEKEITRLRADIMTLQAAAGFKSRGAEVAPAAAAIDTPAAAETPSETHSDSATPVQAVAPSPDAPAEVLPEVPPEHLDTPIVDIPTPPSAIPAIPSAADRPEIMATVAAYEPEPPVAEPPVSTDPTADAAATPAAAPAGRDLEESIGSRWAVWVGGIALALGGLFLVRYSIEAGFFGPGMRLLMGAVFSAIAAGASKYLRRRPELARGPGNPLPGANIPSVLAGVSVLSTFGVVYAAHGVYGFIGPAFAFTLMGLIGLAALAASLLHGTALGLFGLVGSYATPFLVSSSAPSLLSLSLFIAVVTAAAFLMHTRRPDRLVTLGAVAGHGLWTLLIAEAERGDVWSGFLIVAGAGLALALLLEWPLRQEPSRTARATPFDTIRVAGQAMPFDMIGFVALVTAERSGLSWRFSLRRWPRSSPRCVTAALLRWRRWRPPPPRASCCSGRSMHMPTGCRRGSFSISYASASRRPRHRELPGRPPCWRSSSAFPH